jgi:predicted metalloprotease with PDZ domain
MRRDAAFMRVYWSGAAIALLADLKLRRRGQSLDQALSDLQRCCLQSNRKWAAKEIMDKLDELTGTRIFSDLYTRYVHADAFPDLTAAYRHLGLLTKNDTFRLDDSAPLAHVRNAITLKAR